LCGGWVLGFLGVVLLFFPLGFLWVGGWEGSNKGIARKTFRPEHVISTGENPGTYKFLSYRYCSLKKFSKNSHES